MYGLVQVGSEWMVCDAIKKDSDLGFEAQGITRAMETIVASS